MRFSRIFRYAPVVLWLALTMAQPAHAERKVALVVGNSSYVNVPRLPNPRNDAGDMIARLKTMGFDVIPGLDLDRNAFLNSLAAFGRAAEGADVALFFYAGHGLQVNGQNYLVPTDAKVEFEAELDIALIPVPLVMQQLARGSRVNIVLLDACRDNPFAKDLSRTLGTRSSSALGRGLSRIQTASGTFIAFATQPDNVAQDGDGRNSPFTGALLANIDTPGLSLSDLMIEVRNAVMQQTNGKQVPWDSSSLTGRFSFKIEGTVTIAPQTGQPQPSAPVSDTRTIELNVWNAIQNTSDSSILEKFLKDFPNGVFAGAAKEKLARLGSGTAPLSKSLSGTPRQSEATEAPGGMTLEADTDRPGLDYRRQANIQSPEACATICAREEQCRAFTWVQAGVQGPEPYCWLKGTVPMPKAARFAVSGIKSFTADAVAKPPASTPQDACASPAVIDDDFTGSGKTVGIRHGVTLATGPNGGASFSRRRESRIVYPYIQTGLPKSGTLEWAIKVSSGYFYSAGKLTERTACALIFTTDIQNGDVTWPGSAWLYACNNGDIRFHIAGAKFEAGSRPEYRLEAKATAFRYDEWHRVGVSYGSEGRYIMLDGKLVASEAAMTQQLGAGGTHEAPVDNPTIGESVSGFWPDKQHEGGFEGTCARFRASDSQRNWCLSR
jgi:uncharacterized caspase-like protein